MPLFALILPRACVPECPRAEPTQLSQLISAPFPIKSRGVGSGRTVRLGPCTVGWALGRKPTLGRWRHSAWLPSGLVLVSPTSSEHACPTSGLLCGWLRVCVALVESVLRPSGWEKKCRLTCHCVRHISPDNKHGQPVKARHSLPSRWRAGTELCVPTNRKSRAARRARWGARTVQGAHAGFGSPSIVRSVPPRFDRAGLKTRRALVAFLRLCVGYRLGKSRFCKISQRDPTSARSFLE